MKKILISLSILLLTQLSYDVKAQNSTMELELNKIDSLINANIDIDAVDKVGKNDAAPKVITRGSNPCEFDYENLIRLFKSLKSNYISCCKGESNFQALTRIVVSVYSLLDNPKCKWEVSQWLVFGYYLNDYSNFVKRNNCCK